MKSIRSNAIRPIAITAIVAIGASAAPLSYATGSKAAPKGSPPKARHNQDFVDQAQSKDAHQKDLFRSGWRLLWQDNFDGTEIEGNKWGHEVNCAGGGNNEKQCYTARPENSFIDDGVLHIVAREELYSGPALGDDDHNYNPDDASKTLPYTSARLRTKGKFDFTYGRVEVRAKAAGGQGMWPAIWMLPTDSVYGGWPSSGEIDIMEAVNLGVWGNEIHGTNHYGLKWPQWENHGQTLEMDENPADDYHVYAIEWEADEIRWYVDGQHYQTQTSNGWYNYVWQGQEEGFQVANPRAPYDQNFHLILNVAAGGDWPGDPDTGWTEDREMLVDYVRVYQCHQPKLLERKGKAGLSQARCATTDETVAVNSDAGAPGVNDFLLYGNGPETLSFDIDGNAIDNTLVPGYWELEPGTVFLSEMDLGGEHGTVGDIMFNGIGNVFLGSADMSGVPGLDSGVSLDGGAGWTNNGELKFDLFVFDAAEDSQLIIKMDSGWPNGGQVVIDTPAAGEWHQVSVSIADLLENPIPGGGGVDLSSVLNLFVLEHIGSHASVQVDNIRLQCAYNTEPESWQLDQTCGMNPRIASAPLETPVGFEELAVLYNFADFAGGATAVVPNPDLDGNGSATVGQMQKYFTHEWEHWGGSTLALNRTVDVPEGSVFTMKVWSQRSVEVLFKLEGVGEIKSVHSGSGWEELIFDFTGITGSTNALTLIFDLGTPGDAGGDPLNWTFYFDDIAI